MSGVVAQWLPAWGQVTVGELWPRRPPLCGAAWFPSSGFR